MGIPFFHPLLELVPQASIDQEGTDAKQEALD